MPPPPPPPPSHIATPNSSAGPRRPPKPRKAKGTVVSLQQFLANDSRDSPSNHVLRKLKSPYDGTESDDSHGSATVYELPIGPLGERSGGGGSPERRSRLPQPEKFFNWRDNRGSGTSDDRPKPSGAVRKPFKGRYANSTPPVPSEAQGDFSSWRGQRREAIKQTPASPALDEEERPKLKLQPRSLPLPKIILLPDDDRPQRQYAKPEPKDTRITIKKRLIDLNDRDGVPCNDPEAENDRLEAAVESMHRRQVYLSRGGDREVGSTVTQNWRRCEGFKVGKDEPNKEKANKIAAHKEKAIEEESNHKENNNEEANIKESNKEEVNKDKNSKDEVNTTSSMSVHEDSVGNPGTVALKAVDFTQREDEIQLADNDSIEA